MDCRSAGHLVHAYLDDELELVGSYEFERHVEECAACAQRLAKERSLRARIAGAGLSFGSPPHLREKIAARFGEVRPTSVIEGHAPLRWGRWMAGAAAAAIVIASLFTLVRTPSEETLLAQQVRDGHVRSLLADHLNDVESPDQHKVKPWFAGRLDFSPWVGNLANEGFPLVGGRVDFIDNRRVAAIVYKRREHVINLFMWRSPDSKTFSPRLEHENNYQMLHWSRAGITFWAISDLNSAELHDFVTLVQSRMNRPDPEKPALDNRGAAEPAVEDR